MANRTTLKCQLVNKAPFEVPFGEGTSLVLEQSDCRGYAKLSYSSELTVAVKVAH